MSGLGLDEGLPLKAAVQQANTLMGLPAAGALPAQVDALTERVRRLSAPQKRALRRMREHAEQLMRIGRIGNPQTISLTPRPPNFANFARKERARKRAERGD